MFFVVVLFFFYLEGNEIRDTDSDRPSSGFIPQMPSTAVLGQAETRSQNSNEASDVGGRDTSTWAIISCLPGCVLAGSRARTQIRRSDMG